MQTNELDTRSKKQIYQANYYRHKYRTNDKFRTQERIKARIRKLLRSYTKTNKTRFLLGCTSEFIKKYIEDLFLPGMSWDNYGEWQLDHIVPCNYFDLSNELEQKICFNYRNLRPLWTFDNISKSDKLPENYIDIINTIKSNLNST